MAKAKTSSIATRDGYNESLWQSKAEVNPAPILADNQVFDTLIIGGGITGTTLALLLQKAGKKCVLVEAKQLGYGTTGGTTAHLNTFLDTTYPEIDSKFGKDASKLIAKATKEVIDLIKSNIEDYGIDADFEYKDGYLFSQNEKESDELSQLFESAKEAGVEVTEVTENGVSIEFERALRFSNQAQFHPISYINGLAKEFTKIGGILLENTFVNETSFDNGIHTATADQQKIQAKSLVWATHIPPGVNLLSLRNAPYRSYVMAVTLKNGNYPNSLAYDMKEPYHYFRSHTIDGQPYLIVGGEDHKTGHDDPEQSFQLLEDYVKSHFEVDQIAFRWSSQYYVPVDGLPYIGKLPGGDEHLYVATGFNGNGMIFGTLSATIIADLISGKENPYAELLSPSRLKPVAGFTEFVKENADVAYHFVADRISPELLASLSDLPNGEGKVVKFDGKKLAVHKDEGGKVTALNPICTHAGCVVSWNPTEKSWDCPCHGGRFTIDGEVITGPPTKALSRVDLHAEE